MKLICPICSSPLARDGQTYRCENRHSFDIARQGYINLLAVQQKHSLNPGDTRQQVLCRREFLESGYYQPILDTLIQTATDLGAEGPLLDVGCGEGYYASRLSGATSAELIGLDISKEAVRCAAAKYKGPLWICATAAHLPIEDHSIGMLTSLFALTLPEEYHRVLRDDGLFFQILAAEDHLLGLKSIIYPELKHKPKDSVPELPGFERIHSIPIRFPIHVERQQIQNLLSMTPHLFRISKEGAARLEATKSLQDIASCILNVYKPITM